jgi:hypothetical protein
MPARHKTLNRIFEAFSEEKLLFWDVFIAGIVPWITWICLVQRRWANIVTPRPEFHLLFSVLGCRFSFVNFMTSQHLLSR